jgi:hypothetical protein
MSEWATHSAELARKSLARLFDGLALVEAGTMTTRQLYGEVDTLSEVTQGLIPQEDWVVIDTVRRELKKEWK